MDIVLEHAWVPVENEVNVPYRWGQPPSAYFRERWNQPAVYRWLINDGRPGTKRLYIGEADQLYRRVTYYLKPGPTQHTNIRLKRLFDEEREQGHTVHLEVLQFEPFSVAGNRVTVADLGSKMMRVLLEALFGVQFAKEGYTLLNARL